MGYRWAGKTHGSRAWGRRLQHHGGTSQINVPKEILKLLGWEIHDIVLLEVVGDELRIHRPAVRELKLQEEKT